MSSGTTSGDASAPAAAGLRVHVPEDLLPGYLFVQAELSLMAQAMRVPRDAESEPAQVFNLQMLLR